MAETAVQATIVANEQDTAAVVEAVEDKEIHAGWLMKKPAKRGKTHKRYFILRESGAVAYYAAVTPEGKPVAQKGVIQIFSDTTVKVSDGGKGINNRILVTSDAEEREWHLIAETEEEAQKWKSLIDEAASKVSGTSTETIGKKNKGGKMLKKLSDKVGQALTVASSTMKTFGFAGSVKVTGSIVGVSVSMGLSIELEQSEGTLETPVQQPEEEEEEEEAGDMDGEEEGEGGETADSAEKQSKFKNGMKRAMKGAMKKVKVLAFTMRKYNLSGTVGVGVDMTVFGTGITIEFEIELSSALTEVEFEEMLGEEETTEKSAAASPTKATQ